MNITAIPDDYCNNFISDYVHTLAHDLREPLRCINGVFQLLLQSNQEKFDEESSIYVNLINNNMKIINDFILNNLKEADSSQVVKKKTVIDSKSLVQDIREILYVSLKETKGEIRMNGDMPLITGNLAQIRQVFTNIIDNALKYRSEKQPLICISCTESDAFVEFSISDNGRGIALQEQENIFKKFKRLNTAESTKGSGLGLWICKKIIESHGGTIQASNNSEGGALFMFSLPKAYTQPSPTY
jgi:K+-sensing histidine kinase KdpD